MPIVPLPTPLQQLGGRRFSFYPPIRDLGPNEWLYRRATGSECVVANAQSGEEVWIPRLFLGEVSRVDEPVMLVRLNRELEWKSGAIIPRQRSVIELPVAVNVTINDSRPAPSGPAHLAPVVSIRLEPKPEVRAWRWIGVAAVLGAVACTIVTNIAYQSQSRQRADLFRGHRPWLQLSADDDFGSTVRKLGAPLSETSAATSGPAGDRVFRSLVYNLNHTLANNGARRYSVILMGSKRENARYIGTLDTRFHVLDAARYPDGSTAEALLGLLPRPGLLRSLPSF